MFALMCRRGLLWLFMLKGGCFGGCMLSILWFACLWFALDVFLVCKVTLYVCL